MANKYLDDILKNKRCLLEEKKVFFSSLKEKLSKAPGAHYRLFHQTISQPGQINLIAKIYVDHKVAAISVLTEEKYFLGNPSFVKQINDRFNIPVLTKDFIIDEGQIYEARLNGASAILLIAAILNDDDLRKLREVAASLYLDCLLEVHDEEELKRAVDSGAEIIGINNRDLRTFKVDIQTCRRLIPKIPKDKVIVAESGIKSHQEVQMLKELGANAVLIGETFMRAKDIDQKIHELMDGL
jgi:indole-3-glycerol phosphate synthase